LISSDSSQMRVGSEYSDIANIEKALIYKRMKESWANSQEFGLKLSKEPTISHSFQKIFSKETIDNQLINTKSNLIYSNLTSFTKQS
ncbi:MAG: hypothetical protein ACRCZZ_09715, partial [Phocaeicola sp.]